MSKKKLGTLLLLFTLALGYAHGQEISTISGTWTGDTNEVNLYRVKDGRLVSEGSSTLNDKKQFIFAINQSESNFYVVGLQPVARLNKYIFYMKPGDRLNVDIDNPKFDYKLVGNNNSAENIELKRWFDASHTIQMQASYAFRIRGGATYVQFFPALDEILEVNKNYALQEPVEATFVKKFESLRKLDIVHTTLLLLYTPRSAHPQDEDYPDYINNEIDLVDLAKDDQLLTYPFGNHLFEIIKMRQAVKDKVRGDLPRAEMLDVDLSKIANPILKGDAVLSSITRLPTYEPFMEIKTPFEKYLVTDYQKKVIKDREMELALTAKGVEAMNFTFRDKNDKLVSLTDFKGKVVYIDVWATWCAPCLKEAPHWKELYENNKSKDIVFLGISIDDEKDHAKWLAHVAKEGEVGVQLFAGKDTKAGIGDPYRISGIPRFILISKDGKLIETNAKRPSNTEVQKDIDDALAL